MIIYTNSAIKVQCSSVDVLINGHRIISDHMHSVIVTLCTFTYQVSKADRPACVSEVFTVSGHLKCGLSHGLLPLAIVENITVLGGMCPPWLAISWPMPRCACSGKPRVMSCLGFHRPSSCVRGLLVMVTPSMRLARQYCTLSSLFVGDSFLVHVPASYRSVEVTAALHTLAFVFLHIPRCLHNLRDSMW